MLTNSSELKLLEKWSDRNRNSGDVQGFAQNSYDSPKQFWEELLQNIEATSGATFQSKLFQSYHFYHDCVVRHLDQNLIAFKCMEEDGWREWSYDHLHRLVNYQVERWRNQLQDWTENVAIVMPLGINFFVGVLTAVRLGLTFTVLPLDSPLLPERRVRYILDKLKVNIILTTPKASPTISGDERHWLIEYLEESEKYEQASDFTFEPGDHIQLAYSCHGQRQQTLAPVNAQEMYLNALRDGYLTFGLRSGMTLGYSPDCSLREQPYLFFTALLSGATTAILPDAQLQKNPDLASSLTIDVLGVTPTLRDLWVAQQGLPKSRLTHWYYNLFDDDQKAWLTFTQRNQLENLASTRLVIDNSSSGVPVTSVKVNDEEQDPLWPSFGVEWDLLQYGQQEVSSVYPYGVFKQNTESSLPSNLLLNNQRVGWGIATTVTPQTRGYTIPLKEMEETAESLEFVDFAYFLTLPTPYSPLRTQGILLVFINPMLREELSSQQGDWESSIKMEIKNSLGAPFIPNKIEFFPLIPRLKDESLDRDWCQYQYTSGYLSRKKTLPAYHWLSLLKRTLLDQ